jgi:hypothetical protein
VSTVICASATRDNVIIKVVMRKENSCPNFREFRISEVSLCLVGVSSLIEVQELRCSNAERNLILFKTYVSHQIPYSVLVVFNRLEFKYIDFGSFSAVLHEESSEVFTLFPSFDSNVKRDCYVRNKESFNT